ncbi:hypothetical protein [Mycolicibacterium sp. 050158]|uniref:hypothetical protein n=1 Tax=Mycolicibacterium sp. 050158 TaxID=3090602 RepID=UPI00299D00AB|nr:hypothetical protein [Mycolicibacterium sp. 050158]MDX1890457.1 hypothetical protein [Mycolicibacterium sp. 050158]
MRAVLLTLITPAALAIGLLGGPANVASAESSSAIVTIGQLQAEGFTVNVDRVGSAPLSACTVTSVRNPQTQTQVVPINGRGNRNDFIEVVTNRSITVSLDCSSR